MRKAIFLALAGLACTGSDNVRPAFDYRGPKGDVGPAGPQGPKGETGPAGAQGPQGIAGPQGPQGISGPMGPQGPQGATGIMGLNGLAGPQGPMGPIGPQGPQGPRGDNGARGERGLDGESPTITPEAAGTNCANGGLKVVFKTNTYYVCNGTTTAASTTLNVFFWHTYSARFNVDNSREAYGQIPTAYRKTVAWSNDISSSPMTWAQAEDYCHKKEGTYTDRWRLPNEGEVYELSSGLKAEYPYNYDLATEALNAIPRIKDQIWTKSGGYQCYNCAIVGRPSSSHTQTNVARNQTDDGKPIYARCVRHL